MAFNPSPEVAVARDAAKRLGADRAIVFYTLPNGKCGYASYGQNMTKCREARAMADMLWDTFMDNAEACEKEVG